VDEHQHAIVESEKRLATARDELNKTRQAVQEQQELLEADVRRLEAELKEAEVSLPSDVRDAYDRGVKSKGSDAMAAVENDSCGGCFSRLTPNIHNALAMGRIVFCQSCGRLMYLSEDRGLAPSGA
jgi:predicted  nucleic acid-binding Zn-ribbon protein